MGVETLKGGTKRVGRYQKKLDGVGSICFINALELNEINVDDFKKLSRKERKILEKFKVKINVYNR